MSKQVPDAWDDDYANIADKPTANAKPEPPVPRVSRAERKAKHIEANKELWNSAENPETFHFIDSRNDVPLKSEFKPGLKVLSRKPQQGSVKKQHAQLGDGSKTLEDGVEKMKVQDDETDSEEEARREQEREFEERKVRAKKEREEKQRKYQEVRERLFGPSDQGNSTSGGGSRGAPSNGNGAATRGRGNRGNRRGRGNNSVGGSPGTASPRQSSTDSSPARAAGSSRELYDPDYATRSVAPIPQSSNPLAYSRTSQSGQSQHIRQPHGPNSSGRGGFGFAPRGGG